MFCFDPGDSCESRSNTQDDQFVTTKLSPHLVKEDNLSKLTRFRSPWLGKKLVTIVHDLIHSLTLTSQCIIISRVVSIKNERRALTCAWLRFGTHFSLRKK